MIYRYATKDLLSLKQAESVVSKLIYSVEGIMGCNLDYSNQDIIIEYADNKLLGELEDVVSKMVSAESNIRIINKKILYTNVEIKKAESENKVKKENPVIDMNIKKDYSLLLFKKLDEIFLRISRECEAELREYPSLIKTKTMERCNYVHTFPQNVFLVSEFPHQLKVLEKIKSTNNKEAFSRHNQYLLSPAVCFHCYEEFKEKTLTKPVILTAKGSCFRHEASWRVGNYRLNEFNMREIIYVGEKDFVHNTRSLILEKVWSLFNNLGLTGRVEAATDPFYFPEDSPKGQYQLMTDMKYELIVDDTESKESFSICSFNNVKDTLCKPFNITDNQNNYLHSGCVAFGIERWVYAFILKYGTEKEEWPEKIKELLNL